MQVSVVATRDKHPRPRTDAELSIVAGIWLVRPWPALHDASARHESWLASARAQAGCDVTRHRAPSAPLSSHSHWIDSPLHRLVEELVGAEMGGSMEAEATKVGASAPVKAVEEGLAAMVAARVETVVATAEKVAQVVAKGSQAAMEVLEVVVESGAPMSSDGSEGASLMAGKLVGRPPQDWAD